VKYFDVKEGAFTTVSHEPAVTPEIYQKTIGDGLFQSRGATDAEKALY
jgi:hypothetical protein